MLSRFPGTWTARRPIDVVISPFVKFAKIEAASGILLVVSTIAALVWANSAWSGTYETFWHAPFSVGFGPFTLTETRHDWINDGLMPIFFFLVGLEIKREVLIGELSSFRQAAFPLISALGGAIVPIFLYLCFARGGEVTADQGAPIGGASGRSAV